MTVRERARVLGMGVVLLANAVLPACSGTHEGSPEVTEPTSADRVDALKLELGAAHRAWSEGRREEAQGLVRTAYHEHFEPLEPALRSRDPLGTLELEYSFGRLEKTFGQPGNPVVVIEDVRAMNREIEAALVQLQAPEPGPAP